MNTLQLSEWTGKRLTFDFKISSILIRTFHENSFADCLINQHSHTRKRKKKDTHSHDDTLDTASQQDLQNRLIHWKRIILLIAAVTIHNIPGTIYWLYVKIEINN